MSDSIERGCHTCVRTKDANHNCGSCIWNYTRKSDNWKIKPSLKHSDAITKEKDNEQG